jgi:DNA polymerase III subunit delta'
VSDVIGQDHVVERFLAALAGDRLHHAWLLMGAEGLGKATLAWAFAKRMLAGAVDASLSPTSLDVPDDHPTVRLMQAGSHPDLRLLERLSKDEKRDRSKREDQTSTDLVRNITIDQVRRLTASFATTPSMSSRRVVIIDSIDNLERNAANALLKTLEEPPKGTIFLLVSHAPGRLLPTIRSRCQTLKFATLNTEQMERALRKHLPEGENQMLSALISMARGSPGKAIRSVELDIVGMTVALSTLSDTGDPTNSVRTALAKSFAGKHAQARYEHFLTLAPQYIADAAKERHGRALENAIAMWDAARNLAQNASHASLDPQAVVFALAGYVAALAPPVTGAKA